MMSAEVGRPRQIAPERLNFNEGLVHFSHAANCQDHSIQLYFNSLPRTGGKRQKSKPLRNVVCTFRNCFPDTGSPDDNKFSSLDRLESLDENISLVNSNLTTIPQTNESQSYRLHLTGTQQGGRYACNVSLAGKLTVTQLSRHQFLADCVRHKQEAGQSEGQRFWSNFVNSVIEENFPNTMRLLLGES